MCAVCTVCLWIYTPLIKDFMQTVAKLRSTTELKSPLSWFASVFWRHATACVLQCDCNLSPHASALFFPYLIQSLWITPQGPNHLTESFGILLITVYLQSLLNFYKLGQEPQRINEIGTYFRSWKSSVFRLGHDAYLSFNLCFSTKPNVQSFNFMV